MFHKFLGMSGRALKPVVMGNNPNIPTQHIWSDAVFIKDIFRIAELPADKQLKLGLISFIYGSPDVAFQCFKTYDEKKGTGIHATLFDLDERIKKQKKNAARNKMKKSKR